MQPAKLMAMAHPARLVWLLALAVGAWAQSGEWAFDSRRCTLAADRLVAADGREVGRVQRDAGRGGQCRLTPEGGLLLGGHVHGESLATFAVPGAAAGALFEVRFALGRPEGFYGHMVILAPRVGAGPDAPSYRIAYRFVGPCPVANHHTGFYLSNTAHAAARRNPLYAPPLAGGRYRLVPQREYVARALVRDVPGGVNVRFWLHDTTLVGDDEQPLFDYTDRSPERLTADRATSVQVGAGALIHPAPPTWFGGLRVLPADRLDAVRRSAAPPTVLPDLSRPPLAQRTELPNVFSDRLVLQRGKPIRVWGRGIEGDSVTVSLAGASAVGTVVGGRWRVELPAQAAGGPHELTVRGRDRTLTVREVLVGEVWVLGGQSNMGWYLKETTEAAAELPRANHPTMRFFDGWHPAAGEPQFELAGGAWRAVTPQLDGAFSAVGYYFAKELAAHLRVPIGLVNTSTPATGIECWVSPQTAQALWAEGWPRGLADPGCYYHGKVAPVLPLSVAGIVWYQGDGSSAATGTAYGRYIPALIADWRRGFDQGELPFLIVQIPRYQGCSPEMRESQLRAARDLPRVGLAVTLDTGDPTDIHPRDKRPVGERLALLARALGYGEALTAWGPVWRAATPADGGLRLTFDHAGDGLVLRGAGGFELRAAGGPWQSAQATVVGRDQVLVASPAVPAPVAARYAWAPVPPVTLYNTAGLPASPFRTSEEPSRGDP